MYELVVFFLTTNSYVLREAALQTAVQQNKQNVHF